MAGTRTIDPDLHRARYSRTRARCGKIGASQPFKEEDDRWQSTPVRSAG